jgi:hypothetical protein
MYVRLCNFEGGAARKPPHISSRRAGFRTDREDQRLLPTTGLMVNEKSHPDIFALKNAPFALFIVTRSYTAAAKNRYVLVTVLEICFNCYVRH